MEASRIETLGDELYHALTHRQMIDPLTEREPDITIEDAYHISLRMVNRRVEAGERIIGKKIGVTSKAVQNMLNVHQPDFGYLTDRMVYGTGDEMPVSELLIQPRAEGGEGRHRGQEDQNRERQHRLGVVEAPEQRRLVASGEPAAGLSRIVEHAFAGGSQEVARQHRVDDHGDEER